VLKIVYNLAQTALSTSLAGWAVVVIGRPFRLSFPLPETLGTQHYPEILVPVIVFGLTAFLLNTSLVGAAVATSQRLPFLHVWQTSSAWQASTQIPLALLGVALAQAMVLESWIGLVLFALPLVVSRGVFQGYVRLREAYADTVRGLVAAIEAKDPYTRGHSERVAEYAVSIADSMRLPPHRIEQLELSALLHDLGKVGVGRRILTKAGRLSDVEMDVIKRHPRIGADIIRSVGFLQTSLPGIEFHHERFDGNGYGAGLSGEHIPLEARVLAVADSYDAMTSERPYRSSFSHEEATEELARQSGRQFDPYVVQVFLSAHPANSGVDHD
jgi:HD-GYP domain-containing protein (c-di-GMP phosphodiesterase class II)